MREMSPKQFHEEFGFGSISRVDRHLKELIEHGWIRYVRSKTGDSRRSAEERFYRATELAARRRDRDPTRPDLDSVSDLSPA
jgi:SOS-response transcriptional repressor LexA